MANLIITVIAIALVAVASLMGAYYGGSAFLNNKSAAGAAAVLNQGQQVAGAFQAYLNDNANTPPSSWANLTSSNYLQSIPVTPAMPGPVAAQEPIVKIVGGHYYMEADAGAESATSAGTGLDVNAAACVKVIKTAIGTAPTGTLTTTAFGSIASGSFGNGTYGCTVTSSATVASGSDSFGGNGSVTTGHYVIEYKLY